MLQKYVNYYIGVSSLLDEMQAALGVKLRCLDQMTKHKGALADVYFANFPTWLKLTRRCDDTHDVFYILGVRSQHLDELRAGLLGHGVNTEIHYPTLPRRQVTMRGGLSGDHSISDRLHSHKLSLPISIGHTTEEIHHVCDTLERFKYYA